MRFVCGVYTARGFAFLYFTSSRCFFDMLEMELLLDMFMVRANSLRASFVFFLFATDRVLRLVLLRGFAAAAPLDPTSLDALIFGFAPPIISNI